MLIFTCAGRTGFVKNGRSDNYSLARGYVLYIVANFDNNAAEFMARSNGVFGTCDGMWGFRDKNRTSCELVEVFLYKQTAEMLRNLGNGCLPLPQIPT